MSTATGNNVPRRWSAAGLELGEGPRWVDGRLVLVDILTGRLFERHDASSGPLHEILRFDVPLGAAAPVAGRDGRWIVAAGTGIAFLEPSGDLDWLARPADGGAVPRRMNDGACDPRGRFWAGCMAWDATKDAGALYRVDHGGTVTQVRDGLTVPNGPAFSPDGRLMYLADSAAGVVLRFPLEIDSGTHGAPDTFVEFDTGSPDGMTVDVNGNVWIAVWGAGRVQQFSPQGTLLRGVVVPAVQPTAASLGGPDGRTLFVTTASYGLPPEEGGWSGDVFALTVTTPGLPAQAFGPWASTGW